MLIRIKKVELSSVKTLGGDRFEDFLKIFENFEFILFKAKILKYHMNKIITEMHFILAYQNSEHRDQ